MCPWCGRFMDRVLMSWPARCPHCNKPIKKQENPWVKVEPPVPPIPGAYKPSTDKEGGPRAGTGARKVSW